MNAPDTRRLAIIAKIDPSAALYGARQVTQRRRAR